MRVGMKTVRSLEREGAALTRVVQCLKFSPLLLSCSDVFFDAVNALLNISFQFVFPKS